MEHLDFLQVLTMLETLATGARGSAEQVVVLDTVYNIIEKAADVIKKRADAIRIITHLMAQHLLADAVNPNGIIRFRALYCLNKLVVCELRDFPELLDQLYEIAQRGITGGDLVTRSCSALLISELMIFKHLADKIRTCIVDYIRELLVIIKEFGHFSLIHSLFDLIDKFSEELSPQFKDIFLFLLQITESFAINDLKEEGDSFNDIESMFKALNSVFNLNIGEADLAFVASTYPRFFLLFIERGDFMLVQEGLYTLQKIVSLYKTTPISEPLWNLVLVVGYFYLSREFRAKLQIPGVDLMNEKTCKEFLGLSAVVLETVE